MHVVKRVGRNAKKGCPTMGAPKGVPCMRLVRRPPQGRTHDRPGSNGGAGRVEGVLTRETDIAESNPGLRRPHMGSWRMRASVPNRSATKPSHNGKGAMAYMNPPPRASRRARRPKYGLWGRGLHGGGHFPWLRRRMAALEAAAARLGWRNGGMGHSAALYLGCGSCGTHDTTTTGTRPTNVRHDQHTPGRPGTMCTVGGTAPAPAAARRWAARAPPDEGGDEHALDPPEAARRGPDDGPRERAARARGGGRAPCLTTSR